MDSRGLRASRSSLFRALTRTNCLGESAAKRLRRGGRRWEAGPKVPACSPLAVVKSRDGRYFQRDTAQAQQVNAKQYVGSS
jgi:hypothetical protein